MPEKIPIVFHDGSNYDNLFIIKELAEEFKNQFNCSGENTEKYITLTVPIEKEVTRIDMEKKLQIYIYIYIYMLHITIYWWHKIYGKFFIKSC